MFAQSVENFLFLTLGEFPLHLVQREMNDVVMVNFLAWQFIAQLQPYFVQQIDFFRRQARRMRPVTRAKSFGCL